MSLVKPGVLTKFNNFLKMPTKKDMLRKYN